MGGWLRLAARAHQPEHLSGRPGRPGLVGRQDVHLAGEILAEAEHIGADAACRTGRNSQLLHMPEALLARLRDEDRPVGLLELPAPIAEDVVTAELGQGSAAVDVAADDGRAEAAGLVVVCVLDDGVDERVARARMWRADGVGALARRGGLLPGFPGGRRAGPPF